MSNQFSAQIISDGPRNAAVKIDGYLDTADAVLAPAVALTDFSTQDQNLKFAGFRVDSIDYSISSGLIVSLFWEAMVPQSLARLVLADEIVFEGGIFPDRTKTGYTGSILLSSSGFSGQPAAFTLVLNMIKIYTRGDTIASPP